MFWEDRLNTLDEIGTVTLTRKKVGDRKTWQAELIGNIKKVGDKKASEGALIAMGETPQQASINLYSKLCGFNTHLTEQIPNKKPRTIRWNGIWQVIVRDEKTGIWIATPRDEYDDAA